jgi:hypothetical protein
VFSLQGKDTSKLAGNWFQLLMVLFTKEYLSTSVLWKPTSVLWFDWLERKDKRLKSG